MELVGDVDGDGYADVEILIEDKRWHVWTTGEVRVRDR